MIGAVLLTIWYCHTADPFCKVASDPTPAHKTYESYLQCEEAMGIGTLIYGPLPGILVRHTCAPAGEDL